MFHTLSTPVLSALGGGTSGPLSPCVWSLGYKLSSARERPSPEECLQDLSKHLQCWPAVHQICHAKECPLFCFLMPYLYLLTPLPAFSVVKISWKIEIAKNCNPSTPNVPQMHCWICTLSGEISRRPLHRISSLVWSSSYQSVKCYWSQLCCADSWQLMCQNQTETFAVS